MILHVPGYEYPLRCCPTCGAVRIESCGICDENWTIDLIDIPEELHDVLLAVWLASPRPDSYCEQAFERLDEVIADHLGLPPPTPRVRPR